jgi:hypothetical protein
VPCKPQNQRGRKRRSRWIEEERCPTEGFTAEKKEKKSGYHDIMPFEGNRPFFCGGILRDERLSMVFFEYRHLSML